MKLDYFTLLSSDSKHPYQYNDYVKIYPPTLEDIRSCEGGYKMFQSFTNILAMDKFALADAIGASPDEITGDALLFITKIPMFREAYLSALSFFIRQSVYYDDEIGYVLENGESISMADIRHIKSAILQFCYIEERDSDTPIKFRNAKAKKIYERIQKLKAEQAKNQKDKTSHPDMELSNLIGAVAAFSPSYNLTNIWDLTIFQFYDQFIRLNTKIQVDIFGVRWAAWGQDDFDFTLWHKPVGSQRREQ